MTTKQIAEAVGKEERTVRNWIKKMAVNNSAMAEKLSSSTSTYPADYDLQETCAIIETGLGKNAADLFRMSANVGIKQEDTRLDRLERMVEKLIVAVTTVTIAQQKQPLQIEQPYVQDYYSIMGYARTIGQIITTSEAVKLGKLCTYESHERDLEIRRIPDERYGFVGSYHHSVLKAVWQEVYN